MYLENVTVHGYKAASSLPLECSLPGRFAVLAGPNSSGKSTVAESIVLAHRDVFPTIGRPTSAALSRDVASRTIDVRYALESPDGSPLGELCEESARVPAWTTELSSSMGRISTSPSEWIPEGQLPVLYLGELHWWLRLIGHDGRSWSTATTSGVRRGLLAGARVARPSSQTCSALLSPRILHQSQFPGTLSDCWSSSGTDSYRQMRQKVTRHRMSYFNPRTPKSPRAMTPDAASITPKAVGWNRPC